MTLLVDERYDFITEQIIEQQSGDSSIANWIAMFDSAASLF